ncbi:MAG: hypothetical protein H6707_21405 [Deltaproteobacteria bacterium]|nr:hypothetical protein [Deltaproteobacteria bacterium]
MSRTSAGSRRWLKHSALWSTLCLIAGTASAKRDHVAQSSLQTLFARIDGSPSISRRALPNLDASYEQLHRALFRPISPTTVDSYRRLLLQRRLPIPDQLGRFVDSDQPLARDWWTEIVGTPPTDQATGEARRTVVLLYRLALSKRWEAASSILRFAFVQQGVFRDLCGQLLREMGHYAVPALVRARLLRDPLTYKIKRYAEYQLDRTNLQQPMAALRHGDPRLIAEILRAYGDVRSVLAVFAVIRELDSPHTVVRAAARYALGRYVEGPAPTPFRRRLRLPGGRTTERERQLRLTYRQLARVQLTRRAERLGLIDQASASSFATSTLARVVIARLEQQRQLKQQAWIARALQSNGAKRAETPVDRLATILPDITQTAEHSLAAAEVYRQQADELRRSGELRQALAVICKVRLLLERGAAQDREKRRAAAVAEALLAELLDGQRDVRRIRAARLADRSAPVLDGPSPTRRALATTAFFGLPIGFLLGIAHYKQRSRCKPHDRGRKVFRSADRV